MLSFYVNENHYLLKIELSQALIVISEEERVVVSVKEIGSPPVIGCDC